MGGRRHEGTTTGVGWFGSEPKAPLGLETDKAAHLSPLPPPLLPQLTRAPSPPLPPPPRLLLAVLRAAHAGRAPGRLSWLHREQPGPWKKKDAKGNQQTGSGGITIRTLGPITCLFVRRVSCRRPDCQARHSVHKTLRTCAKHIKSLRFSQKSNLQKNQQAISAGNASLNKSKQSDLTEHFRILRYNPTGVTRVQRQQAITVVLIQIKNNLDIQSLFSWVFLDLKKVWWKYELFIFKLQHVCICDSCSCL